MEKIFVRKSQNELADYISLGKDPKYYSPDDLFNIYQNDTIEKLPKEILVYNYEDINNIQDLIIIVFDSNEEKVEFINFLFKK